MPTQPTQISSASEDASSSTEPAGPRDTCVSTETAFFVASTASRASISDFSACAKSRS